MTWLFQLLWQTPKGARVETVKQRIHTAQILTAALKPYGFTYVDYPVVDVWNKLKIQRNVIGIGKAKTPMAFFTFKWDNKIFENLLFTSTCEQHHTDLKNGITTHMKNFSGIVIWHGIIGIWNIRTLWSTGEAQILFTVITGLLPLNHYFNISANMKFDANMVHSFLVIVFKHHMVPGTIRMGHRIEVSR